MDYDYDPPTTLDDLDKRADHLQEDIFAVSQRLRNVEITVAIAAAAAVGSFAKLMGWF